MESRHLVGMMVRAAATTGLGLVVVCGLLVLLGLMTGTVAAAPLAATAVTGDITASTTWLYTGSPYVLTTAVAVKNGAILTIQPGVEVRFAGGAQLQILNGRLLAQGTATQPITFTSEASPTRGAWEGLVFDTDALTSTVEYALIEYARSAIQVSNSGKAPIDVLSSTIRYSGDGGDLSTGGAIVGSPDNSWLAYNRIYSSEIGISLSKAGSNSIIGNQIYDIDGYGVGLFAGLGTNSEGNLVEDNRIYECRNSGIRLIGRGVGSTADNNIIRNNVISSTQGEAIYARYQNWDYVVGLNDHLVGIINNLIFKTSSTAPVGPADPDAYLGAVSLVGSTNLNLAGNQIYDNGRTGSNYQGAVYISGTTSTIINIQNNLIRDSRGSGLVYDGINSVILPLVKRNAVCVEGNGYELENRDGSLPAAGNWWGTNLPVYGTQITGSSTITPWITLAITPTPTLLPADGLTTAVLAVVMNDGPANQTVPSPARTLSLTTTLGTLSAVTVTLDANGMATATLRAPTTPGTAVVTVTELCGYPVTVTVQFLAADVGISKTTTLTEVIPGQAITYTVVYSNNATVPATNVVITDTLPAGTTWVTDTAGFTRTPAVPTDQVTWQLGSLPAGGSGVITVVARAPLTATALCGQALTNTVTITTATLDANPGNGLAQAGNVRVVCADLVITKLGPAGALLPGQAVTYTLAYTNIGQARADNVVITDVSPITGGVLTLLGGISLNPGVTGTLTYPVTVPASACSTGFLTNTAFIQTGTPESSPANNASSYTNPLNCANLVITKTVTSPAPSFGKVTTYTITYRNTGAFTASGVIITDFLDSIVQYVTSTRSGAITTTPGIVTWAIGDVGPDAVGSFDLGVQLGVPPSACISTLSFTNTVRIASAFPELNTLDNVSTAPPVVINCNQVDLVVLKNDGVGGPPPERPFVWAGDLITYTISYNNVGGDPATGVVLSETLPTSTTFVGPTGPNGWFQAGSTRVYTYQIGTLLPMQGGGAVSFTVRVAPDLPGGTIFNRVDLGGAQPDAVPGDNVSFEQTPVHAAPDLAVVKVGLTPMAHPGDPISYAITVTNQGSISATGIVITDTLPAGTTYGSDTLGGHNGSGAGPITWTVPQLNPGQSASFILALLTNPTICSAAYLVNTVSVAGLEQEGNLGNNTAATTSSTSPVAACADLAITKSVDPGETVPGRDVHFTLVYNNPATTTMAGVQVTDALPPGIDFVSSMPSAPGPAWNIGSLAPGISGTIVITGHVADSLACGTVLTNTAAISSATLDQYLPNNQATATLRVVCGVDLVLVKNDGVGTPPLERPFVQPGEQITYTISYNNVGTSPATGVVLTEVLPNYTSFIGPVGAGGWFPAGTTYTYSLGTVNPHTGGIVRFVIQVNSPLAAVSTITNTVCGYSTQFDVDPTNNCSHEQTPVNQNVPRLNVSKSAVPAGGSTVAVGSAITYTVVVRNDGQTAASNVRITDTLPLAEVTFVSATLSNGGPVGGPNPLTANVASLPANNAVTMTVVVTVNNVLAGTVITNSAQATASALPLQASPPITHVVGISGTAELRAAKSAVASPSSGNYVLRGSLITYTVSVQNASATTPAAGVSITDPLPGGTTLLISSTTRGTISGPNPLVVNVGNLGPGESADFVFTVQVSPLVPLGLVISNAATIAGNQFASFTTNVVSHTVTDTLPSQWTYLPVIIKGGPPPTRPTPPPPPAPLGYVSDVAADPASNQIFIASPRHDWVYVIDGQTDTIARSVPVGHGPTGLAVLTAGATADHKVFVAHQYGANNWQPGLKAFKVFETASHDTDYGGYAGAAPVKVEANTGLGRVYVSNYFDKLAVFDGNAAPPESRLGWVVQKGYQASYGIDASTATNRVYLATRDTGELVVLDGNGDRLLQTGYIPTHFKPPQACTLWSVAVNETTGHVFVPCPQLGKVFVLLDSSQVSILDLEALGTVEERDGNLALVVSAAAAPWLAEISVPGGTGLGEEGIAVDTTTGRVFITNAHSASLIVLQDGPAPAYVRTVPVGNVPQGVDVNPATAKVYVGNAGSNSVTVLNATPPFSPTKTISLTP